jgi:AcrR family transcriptional regulator
MTTSTKSGRAYRLGRRGEAAEETRRRVVQATFDLHAEQGIAETTMAQIAERAGVSVGTVYHHFPTYADAIEACGAFASATVPAPTEEIFEGAQTRRERIARLAHALFDYYRRLPALASVRRDRHLADALGRFADEEVRARRALSARAAEVNVKDKRAAFVAALVDFDACQALMREGFSVREAAEKIADAANAWLDLQEGNES